jgi:hypothetical protein
VSLIGKEKKCSITNWIIYFLTGLAAVWGTEMALFPDEPGNDINLHGYYQKNIEPRLLWWSIIFFGLSAIKLVIWLIATKGTKEEGAPEPHV